MGEGPFDFWAERALLLRQKEAGESLVRKEMKELIGSPGTVCGLILRIGQFAFAAASIGVMVSTYGFSNYTAFWYVFLLLHLLVVHCCM